MCRYRAFCTFPGVILMAMSCDTGSYKSFIIFYFTTRCGIPCTGLRVLNWWIINIVSLACETFTTYFLCLKTVFAYWTETSLLTIHCMNVKGVGLLSPCKATYSDLLCLPVHCKSGTYTAVVKKWFWNSKCVNYISHTGIRKLMWQWHYQGWSRN
jgi:hypothetical protein